MQRRLFLLSLAASVLPANTVDGIVARFAQVARPILLRHCGADRTCVASTRVAIDVLAALGVRATPFPSRILLEDLRRPWRGYLGVPFAWHLVAIADGRLLVDASASQFSAKLPGVIVANASDAFQRGAGRLRFTLGDLAITYERDPSGSGWAHTPEWNHEFTDVIAEILAAMREDKAQDLG